MRAWLHPSILSRPMAQSVIFHMLIVALAMVGWPFLSEKDINAQPLIIVDVVASLPKTNLAASNRAKSSPELEQEATVKKRHPPPPPPAPPPQPVAKAPPPKPAPPKPVDETAENLPDKPVPLPKAKQEAAAPKPKQIKVSTPVSRPAPPAKPKPTPKSPIERPNKLAQKSQQKERAEAMNGVLQNLAQASLAKKAEETQKSPAETG